MAAKASPRNNQAFGKSNYIQQFLDLEEFIDLKSVSNYGWRVDIERLRSKYFVDMMRNKDDDDAPQIVY